MRFAHIFRVAQSCTSLMSFFGSRESIHRILRRHVFHTDRPPHEQRSFLEHARQTSRRVVRAGVLVSCVALIATWPLDYLVYRGRDPLLLWHISEWRAIVCALSVAALIGFSVFPRRGVEVAGLLVCATIGMLGWSVGKLAPLETNFYYTFYLAPFATVVFSVALPVRIAFTITLAVAACVSHVVMNPSFLDYPYFGTTNAVFCGAVFLSVLLGHLVYDLTRANFFKSIELQRARQQSEGLLLNVLPACVAERLKAGENKIADRFEEVTVLFADIVGFTDMSRRMSPDQLVGLLNEMFCRFDQLAGAYGLEKIKTIGDAYMVAGGIPRASSNSAERVAEMALRMREAAAGIRSPDGHAFQLRIGMHTGPAVAGIIGTHKFSYDLWGDTVNIASRMESHGKVGRIQVSEATYRRLCHFYRFARRGRVEVKGVGKMTTYYLLGRAYDDEMLDGADTVIDAA